MKQFRIKWKGIKNNEEIQGELLLESYSRLAACFDAFYQLRCKGIKTEAMDGIEVGACTPTSLEGCNENV
jgi:hypothetical protein